MIADHGRAATFLIGDGVRPGNNWRDYVLRRVMRRAMVHGRKLGLDKPFLGEIATKVMEMMGDIYPDILQKREFILRTILQEEESFGQTLLEGTNRFNQLVSALGLQSGDTLPGEEMFKLYDTHGLTKELLIDMAYSRGLTVDLEGFEKALEEQRKRSKDTTVLKAGDRESFDVYQGVSPQPTTFLGYDYSYLTGDEEFVLGIRNGHPGAKAKSIMAASPPSARCWALS